MFDSPLPSPIRPRHAAFELGSASLATKPAERGSLHVPAHHFVTHGVVVGMTGSGKTGLVTVLAEEALRSGVPVLVLDVKGDLPNLLLGFPSFDAEPMLPFIDAVRDPDDPRDAIQLATELAAQRRSGLTAAGIDEAALRDYAASTRFRVITPGSSAGEPLHLLSSLERRSSLWDADADAARTSLVAAVSLVLQLVGREHDPARSREHVLLSALAERRFTNGQAADLATLIADLEEPPIERIGAMEVDAYVPAHDRHELAASLNSLLASPALASWRRGASLDVGEWLTPADGRTPAVVLSVAHLGEAERALVLGIVLEEVLAWVRSRSGSSRLEAMVIFDEVYGFLPPHPKDPPTKRPLVSLMKQARAFGVGVVLATQNPMDLDYRALGNAGIWCIGRLQTDADRARVVEGLTGASARGRKASPLAEVIRSLPPRSFVFRDAHDGGSVFIVRPRQTISWMRGPMGVGEVRRALRGE